MAGLFLGGGNTTVGTKYNSLSVQSSQQGAPVPIIYGTVKTSTNLIWYGDFQAHEHVEGGKGGGPTVTSYTFTCAVALGVCEGTVSDYGSVWLSSGKTTIISEIGAAPTAGLALTKFYGSSGQTAWSYLETAHPDEALNYRHTAYLGSGNFDLGSSNSLPQMWFEVKGLLCDTGVITGAAAPSQMIVDFLTDETYGCRFPEAYIDTASLTSNANSYERYCGVNGMAFSAVLSEGKAAREYLTSWLEATNTAAIWSADLLKFIPFGDKEMTGYGHTYTPDLTICYALSANDFLHEDGSEPVQITRADPYDCYNNVKLLVRDKDNEYNTAICEVKDQASIELIGLRTRSQISAEFIPTPTAGMMAAELIKNRGLFIRNQYRFRLSWEYALLEPMDLVTLTVSDLGLDAKTVRIMEITEDDQGLLEILAEDFLEGSQWSVQYPPQQGGGYSGSTLIEPGNVNAPMIFEPLVSQIGTANPQIWMVVTGPPATWGGAQVWISTDGGLNYSYTSNVTAGGKSGVLSSTLASGGTSMTVDLTESAGTLSSVSSGDAALGRTAMLVGSEVLAYTTATLTGPYQYTLSGLVRGMYGTSAAAHSTSARLGFLGSSVYKYTIPNSSYYGTTLHLKFCSYNVFGLAIEDLADVADYTYAVTGAGSVQAISIQAGVSGMPAAGAIITTYIAPSALLFPANLTGSIASVGTNPTATAVFSIRKNNVQFATASVSTGGVVTFSGSATSFSSNQVLTVVAPAVQDTTMANVSFLLKATSA
ncbi:MAG: phage tail protein [Chlorobiaceae bacterium]